MKTICNLKKNMMTPERFAQFPVNGKAAYIAGTITQDASEARLEQDYVSRGHTNLNVVFRVVEDGKDATVTVNIAVDTKTNLKTQKAQSQKLQEYYESLYFGQRKNDFFHCDVTEKAEVGSFKETKWVNVEFKKEEKMNKNDVNPLEAYIQDVATEKETAPEVESETKSESQIKTAPQENSEPEKDTPRLKKGEVAGFELNENMSQNERMRAIAKQLEDGVRNFYQSETWREFLQFSSQFYTYSLKNQMLLRAQAQALGMSLSHVGSYKHLGELGFHVRKGQQSLKVYAPCEKKIKTTKRVLDAEMHPILNKDGEPIEEEVETKKLFFKLVPVFDISQTDAKPEDIPKLARPLEGDMKNFEKVFNGLSDFAKENGVTVEMEDPENMGAELGYFKPATKEIKIKKGFDQTETISTLIHEITHSVLDSDITDETDRNTQEVRAESVAYTVMNYLGIDASQYSFGYLVSWAKEREPKELLENMETIQTTAKKIIDCIDKALGRKAQREKEKAERDKKRIETANAKTQAILAKRAEITENSADFERWEFENGYVVINTELDRVQIFFNEKPDYSIRKLLKSKGYHYAPSKGGAWMRKITENAIITTKTILKIA